MWIDGRRPWNVARALALLVGVLAAALPGAAAAQSLTVNGSSGPVVVSPSLRKVTLAWTVPKVSVPATLFVPGITLHVTERPDWRLCLRYLEPPQDLPPSMDLRAAGLTGTTTLNLAGVPFRPGRTYYVRGCVFGLPSGLGGNEDGVATNVVPVRIDWDGVFALGAGFNLHIDTSASRLEPLAGASRVVSSVRATLHIRSDGRLPDKVRGTLPDRLVVEVYLDDQREPEHRAVVTGAAGKLAVGAPGGVSVTVVHKVPPSQETHLVQYVINADGAIPETSYEDNHASMSFGYDVHSAKVTFARNRGDEGPFRVWLVWPPLRDHGDAHAWMSVGYGGGPLREGLVCSRPSGPPCASGTITGRAVDPTPSLDVWLDSSHVGCVGPGGYFEPTLARSRAGGAAEVPPSRKPFFCRAGPLAAVPFDTTEVIVEGRVHGVTTRSRYQLRKAWRAVVADPHTWLPDLVGEVLAIEFLEGQPISSIDGRGCGNHPRARFRVRNDGAAPTPHVIARVSISPRAGERLCPQSAEAFHVVPPLAPGGVHEFEREFWVEVAPAATVDIEVDSGLEAVEITKTNNRRSVPVPTCGDLRGCR